MFRQQSKMNKICSETLLNNICDNYVDLKKCYYSLYSEIVNNKDKSIEEILLNLSNKFDKEYTLPYLSKELKILNSINTSKAYECTAIINYALAKKRNNEENIDKYGEILKKIEERKKIIKERSKQVKEAKKHVTLKSIEEPRNQKQEIIDYMNQVLNDEIKPEELDYKEINSNNRIIKKYLKEIDPEFYVDFIIKLYGVESIDETELKQLKDTINYFVINLNDKLKKIESLDLENKEDVEELYKMNVKGSNESDNSINQYPKILYNRKRKRLERLSDSYTVFLETIDKYIENDFAVFKKFSSPDKRIIREDEEFMKDYISNFKKIYESYNHVNNITTVNDNTLNNIKLIYAKRIVKRNESKGD